MVIDIVTITVRLYGIRVDSLLFSFVARGASTHALWCALSRVCARTCIVSQACVPVCTYTRVTCFIPPVGPVLGYIFVPMSLYKSIRPSAAPLRGVYAAKGDPHSVVWCACRPWQVVVASGCGQWWQKWWQSCSGGVEYAVRERSGIVELSGGGVKWRCG